MPRFPKEYNYVTKSEVKSIVNNSIDEKISSNIIYDTVKKYITNNHDTIRDIIRDKTNGFDIGIYIKENNLIDSDKINKIIETEVKNKINASSTNINDAIFSGVTAIITNELVSKVLEKSLSDFDFTKHLNQYLDTNIKKYLEDLLKSYINLYLKSKLPQTTNISNHYINDSIFWFNVNNPKYVVEQNKIDKNMNAITYVNHVYNTSSRNPRNIKLISTSSDTSPKLSVVVENNQEISSLYFSSDTNKMIITGYKPNPPFTLYLKFKITNNIRQTIFKSNDLLITTNAASDIILRINNTKILTY